MWFLSPLALAQPAAPQAASIAPNTVQRGQSAELTVTGAQFAGANSISLPNPQGVTAELLAAEAGSVRLKLTAAADAAVGKRELRVIGPTGVSNPLTLFISHYPPVQEVEPNNERSGPQDVRLPAVLIGTIDQPGDVDLYRFEAKAGERLVIEVAAAREGYPTDAVLALHNAAGREVAGNNDHHGLDPFIAYQVVNGGAPGASAGGVYTLAIRDLKYRGGAEYSYRITAGPIPYIETIFPLTGQQGQVVEVQPVGYNLGDNPAVKVDLTKAAGNVEVVAAASTTGDAPSNAKPLEVVTVPVVRESEPNDAAEQGNAATVPASVNGRIDRAGDSDTYRFTLDKAMKLAVEAFASRYDSPVDPLLTLRDGQGKVLARNDDAAPMQYDAKIVTDLQPGQYSVTVQDLLYGGSPAHVYRLSIGPDAPPLQNFIVRFQPDALRISRGGHTKVWAEVVRAGGYAGEVAISFEDLPEGVTIDPQPVMMGPSTSGVFTLGAAPGAKLGTFPVRLIATGALGESQARRAGQPQIGNTVVRQAYITVFEQAPFTVRAVDLTPQQIAAYSAELDTLEKKLATPTPELAAKAAEWEKSLGDAPVWVALGTVEAKAAQGTKLAPQPDGSLLATGANPASDTYTIVTQTDLKGITAVKVEVLADDAFPAKGPGRAVNGNFVLSNLALQSTSAADATQTATVTFASAFADYSQPTLTPDKSFDQDMKLGWAVANEFGKDHWAVFQPSAPIGYDGGTKLTFTLLQDFGGQHTIGRLRLSATTAAEVKAGPTLPKAIAAVRATPIEQRTPEQKDALTLHYMARAPELEADRQRAELLGSIVGPAREIAHLEGQLAADNPQVDAAQAQWEVAIRDPQLPKLSTWQAIGPFQARTNEQAFNSPFGPEKTPAKINPDAEYGPDKLKWALHEEWEDGKVHVIGTTVRSATYLYRTIHVDVARKIELSLGSDDGIKVWHNGQQVLSNNVGRGAMPDQEKVVLDLASGKNTLLIKIANGEGGSAFYFKLMESAVVPDAVAAAVAIPADQRTTEQKAAIRAYYRTLDPTLKPVRDRLNTLKAQFGAAFPPVAKRKERVALSVAIEPQPGAPVFDGPVTVTLEGYASGRDPATGLPAAATTQIDITPATLSASNSLGIVSLTPGEKAEPGTRNVVLRAEAKVGDTTWVQYSPAFPLTVKE